MAKLVVCPQCGKKYQLKEGFAAASFSCKSCSATVWVEKPKAAAPAAKKRAAGRRRGRAGARRGRAAAAPKRRQRQPQEAGEEQEGRSRYSAPKSNSTNVIVAVAGGVLIVAIIAVLVMSGKDDDKTATTASAGTGNAADTTPTDTGTNPTPDSPKEAVVDGDEPAVEDDGGEATPETEPGSTSPSKKLGGSKKKKKGGIRKSKYDPPATLGHLEDTPPEMRKKIDELIGLMMDPMAGADSIRSKNQLVALGKPTFLPILGAMAKIRDTVTDVDSQEERVIESSLKLADEALREMDGYLTANSKSTLRPGSEKRYIAYILRLHYRRWLKTLADAPEMPGAFDPGKDFEGEEPEEFK